MSVQTQDQTVLKKIDQIERIEPSDPRHHPVYGVHAYWAKKSSNVVSACIDIFSSPKEIVLDPFAGTGVTVIEALAANRKAIGIDLNPLSAFIMESSLLPASPKDLRKFKADFQSIKDKLWGEDSSGYVKQLYQTDCPSCGRRNAAIVQEARYDSINRSKNLAECTWKLKAVKSECTMCQVQAWRVLIGSSVKDIYEDGRSQLKNIKLFKVDNFEAEEQRLRYIESEKPKGRYPKWRLLENTRINVHKGITIADIYTRRNLLALTVILREIENTSDIVSRALLRFVFGASLHLARMTDYKRASPQNYYVPRDDMTELNYWLAFEDRLPQVEKAKKYIWSSVWEPLELTAKDHWNATDVSMLNETPVMVKMADACKLSDLLGEQTADYIHTDPPYADQVPYFEISAPWIAWLGLLTEDQWKKAMADEIILSDSKERPLKYRQSQEGLDDYRAKFLLSLSEMKKVLRKGRWLSVWYCCTNEEYWRPLTDSLNKLGLERKKSQIVSRAVPTFKQVITVAQKPLSQVREEEILRHYLYTGKTAPVSQVPIDEAIKLFVETTLQEVTTRGEATTGEIAIKFYVDCIDKYDNPPPDYDYFAVLGKDTRFEVVTWKENVGRKEVEYQRWRLKGRGQKTLSDYSQG